MYMETKGIEEMTREELIELVSSLNKDLESTKKDLELYKDWKNRDHSGAGVGRGWPALTAR